MEKVSSQRIFNERSIYPWPADNYVGRETGRETWLARKII